MTFFEWTRRLGLTALVGGLVVVPVRAAEANPPEVSISVSPSTVSAGDTVTVTETLTNINSFTILQPHARILSAPNALASYTSLTGCSGPTIGPCTTFSDTSGSVGYDAPVGSLAGGQSVTVTLTLKVSSSAPGGQQTLQGEIFGTNYATDPIDGPVLTVLSQADVAVTLTGTPKLGLLVPAIELKVGVTDGGPATLSGATVTTSLPLGLRGTSEQCTSGTGTEVCSFGSVANGASATETFEVPLSLLTIGLPYTFTARRTASSPQDPNPANDSATVNCTVITPLVVSCS